MFYVNLQIQWKIGRISCYSILRDDLFSVVQDHQRYLWMVFPLLVWEVAYVAT